MDPSKCLRAALICLFLGPMAASLALEQPASQITASASSMSTTIQTSSGLLKGIETHPKHSSYQPVYKFLAVPYAQAPVGQLRFKRPRELSAEQAKQTLDATKFGKTCPQHRHLTRFISPLLNLDPEHQTSEDCLHLNIFVPSSLYGNVPLEGRRRPVIVWIPGEGFDFADARQFDGSQLALKTESVVVTVQYRVGALGLLDAPELGIEGNQAVHDQLMALRWVQKNIHAFGGDRDQVTVMGRFSGSMSISTMLTAPNQDLVARPEERPAVREKRALFSRAILLSGVATDDWIIVDNQRAKLDALLTEAFQRGICTNKGRESALECLQSMPVEQLVAISGYQWRLVRDGQLISREHGAMVDMHSRTQLPAGVEAVLFGETGTEGTLCLYRHRLTMHLSRYAGIIEENRLTSEHLEEIIRDDMATYFQYNNSNSSPALEVALSALVDSTPETDDSDQHQHEQLRQKYLDACSSFMVRSHNLRFKRHLQSRAKVGDDIQLHHYRLNYKPSFSLAPDYIKTAAHGDDIPLIFGLVYNLPTQEINQADLAMTQKMLAYIRSFVRGEQPQSDNKVGSSGAASSKRNWFHRVPQELPIHMLDINQDDLAQLDSSKSSLDSRQGPLTAGGDLATSQVAKLIIVEAPIANEEQQQQKAEIRQQQVAASEDSLGGGGQLTRSQKLLEFHKQQMLDEGLWMQRRAQMLGSPLQSAGNSAGSGLQRSGSNLPPNDGSQLSAAAETSLATVLLLAASVVILALMSVCVVLSVLVVRYNALGGCHDVGGPIGASKRSQQFNSSSSCNICDESQGANIDAVLNHQVSAKKNEHAFCNVFAKLRNQHHHSQAAAVRPMQNGAGESQTPATGRPLRTASGQHVVESLAATPLPQPQ